MPKVEFEGRVLAAAAGARLRDVLLAGGATPHNGGARALNCRGLGTCGTCAVSVEGEVTDVTAVERWRLGFPPHAPGSGLRLACQTRVLGDLRVVKHGGFWGHRRGEPR
jgi:ferredoxin